MTLVGVVVQNGEHQPIFGMSHGLTNTALALPLFTADAEVRHWRVQWIETHPMQKTAISKNFDGDLFVIWTRLCVIRL